VCVGANGLVSQEAVYGVLVYPCIMNEFLFVFR